MWQTVTMIAAPVNRESLLAKAIDILAVEGVRGVTVRAVSQRAGCSTTGIYTYFGGKQGLLDAIFIDGFRDFRAHLAASSGVDAASVLRSSLIRYREWAAANATQYLLMFGSRAGGYAPSDEAGAFGEPSLDDLIVRVRNALLSRGLGDDERQVAMHLWSVIHGYVMLELTGPGPIPDDPAAFYGEGVDRLLRAYAVA
jgi:AcrR family transcriptional regulator